MNERPFKLKTYTGGMHGHVSNTRSFATREARDREAEYKRRQGWGVSVWRASGPPRGAPR